EQSEIWIFPFQTLANIYHTISKKTNTLPEKNTSVTKGQASNQQSLNADFHYLTHYPGSYLILLGKLSSTLLGIAVCLVQANKCYEGNIVLKLQGAAATARKMNDGEGEDESGGRGAASIFFSVSLLVANVGLIPDSLQGNHSFFSDHNRQLTTTTASI
ncbi:hypothetical protein ACJX0J_008786, partial [Zea mays]